MFFSIYRNIYFFFILLLLISCKIIPNELNTMKLKREKMVKTQIEARGITNKSIIEAMIKIERHKFVPEEYYKFAYDDGPLPIGYEQTISQPYIVAYMTNELYPKKDDKALEIGTGSGYQAAVLSVLVKDVYSIEIVNSLCEKTKEMLEKEKYNNIHVQCGDGYKGWPEKAPFDLIIITAAPPEIPKPLINQLAKGGRMIVPVGEFYQELILIKKDSKGNIEKERLIPVRFVPMTGEAQKRKIHD
ncbi:MAG: protein-L-isoaspartate(D-aspartate) O-methyltransferase [Spirochaetia bacterium]|nr:protein-L-isoaspartate(D-aspartate) O-methyltransferase [Spirochaetia bacterium]